MGYVSGKTIKELRERKKLTQKQLADQLQISDKTVSKWETERGLPDIGIIEKLADCLSVSVAELLSGECIVNTNRSADMRKVKFYICPLCGNVICSTGEGSFSCCGILLPVLHAEDEAFGHLIQVETIENEYYLTMNHPMTKEHYVSFAAYMTADRIQFVKLYPEQTMECRFSRCGHGLITVYCNQHGLFQIKV